MEPDEALRGPSQGRSARSPPGHPEQLTDNRETRAAGTDGVFRVFRPVFDALRQQPARPPGREDGLIDMVTELASHIRNTVDSTGRAESSAGSNRSFWRQQAPTLLPQSGTTARRLPVTGVRDQRQQLK